MTEEQKIALIGVKLSKDAADASYKETYGVGKECVDWNDAIRRYIILEAVTCVNNTLTQDEKDCLIDNALTDE
tara:strand:- start:167 stop:385 length:219 start_codon:yes stop_codon:yes gene_type:complete